jgi:Arabinose-binding domain of AraC transcription regulator, N-term
MMSNEISSTLNSERGLASIPMAQGGLSRLAIARLKSAGVPVAPLLKRVGLTPELIAQAEERLSVRSQIALLDEAAIALKDDCIGFTLARDFDLREIGLLYYVMASSQTLGDALKRVARYSKVTNEALVFGYREGNRLIINLNYSGVPRHSDRHQIEFCMFAAITNLPRADRAEPRAATLLDFSLSIGRHLRNGAIFGNESRVRR